MTIVKKENTNSRKTNARRNKQKLKNKQQENLLQQNIRKINLTIYKLIFMPWQLGIYSRYASLATPNSYHCNKPYQWDKEEKAYEHIDSEESLDKMHHPVIIKMLSKG